MSAALEAAIRANRDDPAAYLVYADWLQTQGDVLGELIVLSQGQPLDAAQAARAEAITAAFGLAGEDLATVTWHRGLWSTLGLENQRDWMNELFDPIGELATPLFTHRACAVLDELRIGILRWDFNHRDVPAVIALAGAQAWAAELRRLVIAPLAGEIDVQHHVIGDIGAVISRSFPRLVELKIRSGEQAWRGEGETFGLTGLDLPRLAQLTIETCAMSEPRLAQLFAAELPALRTLELWFGGDESFAELAPVQPLLAGEVFAGVTELGLRNARFTDELCAALPVSPIAARLAALDLSMGTMTDAGARALAGGAAAFPALQRLSIDDNFLSPDAVAAVRAAFPRCAVESSEHKTADDSIPGEIYRFVSIAE